MNPNQKMQDEKDFAAAFNEDFSSAGGDDMNPEDFAVPEAPGTEGAAPSDAGIAVVIDAGGESNSEPEGDPVNPAAEADDEMRMAENSAQEAEASAEAQANDEEPFDLEKEKQRLRSWEGRLKVRERELSAIAAEPMDSAPDGDDEPTDSGIDAEEGGEMTDESPESTLESAITQLSSDFGEDFVGQIKAIAMAAAREIAAQMVGEGTQSVQAQVAEIINDITDVKSRSHFREIKRVHPDFYEVSHSPAFAEWLRALPEDERAQAVDVAEMGDTDDVIALLERFKQAGQAAPSQEVAPVDSGALDAAEGVPSAGGLRLPMQPPNSQNYQDAWAEFR